jgi:hypothetical protein
MIRFRRCAIHEETYTFSYAERVCIDVTPISFADDDVPRVLTDKTVASPCCYKAVDEPAPGTWRSFNASDESRPFCVEPDWVHQTPSEPGAGGPASGSGGDAHSAHPAPAAAVASSGVFSQGDWAAQHCDILSPPSPVINITSVAQDEWWAWRHHESNSSIFSTIPEAYFADGSKMNIDSDEDHLLFAATVRWFRSWTGTTSSSSAAPARATAKATVLSVMVFILTMTQWTSET